MGRKSPSQSKILNDTHDIMTFMTHAKISEVFSLDALFSEKIVIFASIKYTTKCCR